MPAFEDPLVSPPSLYWHIFYAKIMVPQTYDVLICLLISMYIILEALFYFMYIFFVSACSTSKSYLP